MQRKYFKIFGFTFYLLISLTTTFSTAASSSELAVADSNFKSKKFTQAAQKYDSLLHAGTFTPQMLLKQAYIAEASNEPAQALYYLSLYNSLRHDRLVLDKMEELALAHNIKSYGITDRDLFMTYINDYFSIFFVVGISMSCLLFLLFAVMIVIKRKLIPGLLVACAICLVVVTVGIYKNPKPTYALVKHPSVIVNAPSAGGEPVGILEAGDRCVIKEHQNGWTIVQLEDLEGYAINAHLEPITLP